jgi:hypothetical protein
LLIIASADCFCVCNASVVMIVPLSSRDSISSGKADISFDFSSTDTCPRQIPFSVLQACNNAADDLFYSIPDFFPASGKIKMLKTPTYMYILEKSRKT